VSDPYTQHGIDCLTNKLGIVNSDELARFEARIASIRDVEIATTTIPGLYNVEHLKSFHRKLFADIYPWAGELRIVDISKDEQSRFCHWRYIDDQASSVLTRLGTNGHLLGLNLSAFTEELAALYGDLNVVHPFREGNGRTVRAFLRQLAAAAGYQVDWSALSSADNIRACRDNLLTTDIKLMIEVLRPVIRKL